MRKANKAAKTAEAVKQKPAPVAAAKLSTRAMGAGGKGKPGIVIHKGEVKEYVGIGWVTLHKAEPSDYFKYPEVEG
jgi:hypothetical protein